MLTLDIDKAKTRKKVEEFLKLYSYCLLSVIDDEQLIINRDDFQISINIDMKQDVLSDIDEEKKKFIEYIINRYNRLCTTHRKIIYLTYMIKDKQNDSIIANELGFALNSYYKIKKEAIIRMAYALNIEVYEGDKDEINW